MRGQKITDQARLWTGNFGSEYVNRNDLAPEELDEIFGRRFGITRSSLVNEFIGGLAPTTSILEVGCCVGQQISILAKQGFSNSCGLDLQFDACVQAKTNGYAPNVVCGDSLALPFVSNSFDLVYTFFLLMHIPDHALDRAIAEIIRCSQSYVFGVEAYSPSTQSISYRGESEALWARDIVRRFLKFDGVNLVKNRHLHAVDGSDIDQAFLLKIRR